MRVLRSYENEQNRNERARQDAGPQHTERDQGSAVFSNGVARHIGIGLML
jgi:hypothetical protein